MGKKIAFKLQHLNCLSPVLKLKTRSSINNAKGLTVHRQINGRTVNNVDKPMMSLTFLVLVFVILGASRRLSTQKIKLGRDLKQVFTICFM